MSGYCTIDQVCAAFPQFQRDAPGSIQDSEIQSWIDGKKARIRAALLSRGFDPDAQTNAADAQNFLREMNRDGAVAELGQALQGTVTLQPGEYSVAAERRKSFYAALTAMSKGDYDSLFQPLISSTQDVTPQLSGIGGAEVPESSTPLAMGKRRAFYKEQIF